MQAASQSVRTVCPYCGVGCGMVLQVEDGRVAKVTGDKTHPANFGRLCTKGLTAAQAITNSGRLDQAYMRQVRSRELSPLPTSVAIAETARRLRAILERHGPDALAFYVSGQMSIEAQYLINKLAKGYVGTNNIDSNSRLCMSSAASGYKLSIGADGPPGSYKDFDEADLFFVAGANMADCHPILFLRLMDRRKAGAKLIVVDPRRNTTADKADLFLQIKPGTDLALFNGLLHLIVANNHIDRAFIDDFTEGWDVMPGFLESFTPQAVAQITGLDEADIRTAARWIGEAGNWISCWTMGLNQSTRGTWHTNALCNLHLATGAICRPGSGPFSLTGQPNAMGGREVGYLSHSLPGQRAVTEEADRRFVEALWRLPEGRIRPEPGPDTVSMFKRLRAGDIKAVWIICTNPVATVPNRQTVIDGLKAAELVICQDAYLDTETNIYADILLPGALWAEAQGVMTNSERNLTLMNKAVEPPGGALPDWQIIAMVASEMGFGDAFSYASASDVFDEIRRTWNPDTGYDIRGISYERLRETPVQWPCASETAADRNPVRYLNSGVSQTLRQNDDGSMPRLVFPTESGKARFHARPHMTPDELPDSDFPFVLNTGRLPHQWHTLTKTGKIQTLNKLNPGPFVEIHPDDATATGLAAGDSVELRSRRGKACLPAVISDRVLPGGCFVPFHWNDIFGDDLAINAVTNDGVDAVSMQPGFKYCAIALTRVGPAVVASSAETAAREGLAVDLAKRSAGPAGQTALLVSADATALQAFAHAIGLDPVPQPALSDSERLYLSGFISGIKALGPSAEAPVLPPTAPFSPTTKLWLDGFLAGLFSRSATAPTDGAMRAIEGLTAGREASAQRTVTVLWASQTGNSETLAGRFAAGLSKAGLVVRTLGMDDFPVAALSGEQTILFVTSTYGDGDPPDNGRGFWDALRSGQAPPLGHLSYAVCALGDPSYDQFCQHGKNLDGRLAELGATRLVDRIECDPDFETVAGSWLDRVVSRLDSRSAQEPIVSAAAPAPAGIAAGYTKSNPFPANLVANIRLNGPSADKDTRRFSFDLTGSALSYEAGDALGVWPTNCPELVAEILAATVLDGQAAFAVAGVGELPLDQALARYYELTKPNREFLNFVALETGSDDLKALLREENKARLKEFLWGRQPADILRSFPIRPSATAFLASLKRMQPRLYSIASSPKAHPAEVHLTVSAVRFDTNGRKGACSTFLADRAADLAIPIFMQHSAHFHLPSDPQAPIIMIGPGTGIAPFRGFLHDRRATGAAGRNWLFFGEQHRETDFYYKDELEEFLRDGVLDDLSLAFSRDQPEKIYVQHRMIEKAAELWSWLQDGAHLYVCGDAGKMAKDVDAALHRVIQTQGHLDEEAARDYVSGLARQKRYLRDVY